MCYPPSPLLTQIPGHIDYHDSMGPLSSADEPRESGRDGCEENIGTIALRRAEAVSAAIVRSGCFHSTSKT